MSETATHGERLVRLGVIVGNSRTIMSETPASSPKPTVSKLPASLKGYAQRHGLAETRLFVSPVAHVFTCKSGWSSDGLERALTALQRILQAIRESADLASCPWPTVGIIDMSEQEPPQREQVQKKADDPVWHDGRVALYVVPFATITATEAPWHGPTTLDETRDALLHNAILSASPPETPPMTMRDVVESMRTKPDLAPIFERLRDTADDHEKALERFDSWMQPKRTEGPSHSDRKAG